MSLIDASTYAELRAIETSAMNQTAKIMRDSSVVAVSVPCTVIPASRTFVLEQASNETGSTRARLTVWFPYETDVKNADVLIIDGHRYTVEDVGVYDTATGATVNEVRA